MTGAEAKSCRCTKSEENRATPFYCLCAFVTLPLFFRLESKMEDLLNERV